MSGSQLAALLGGGGLIRDRNDPRVAMAQRLLTYKVPDQIHGKGATIMAGLAAAATGVSNAIMMGRADSAAREERDAAKAQQDTWRQQFQDVMTGGALGGQASPQHGQDAQRVPQFVPDMPMQQQQQPASPSAPRPAGGAIVPPPDMQRFIMAESQRTGVPAPILAAQLDKESSFNNGAVGGVGELGAAQIRPSTARDPGYGVAPMSPEDARDPAKAVRFQADYLVGKGRAVGATDWSNPEHQRRGVAAYNGAGPQAAAYAEDVLARSQRVQLGGGERGRALAAPLMGGAAPSPQQQALADRLTPEGVERLQRGAALMYAQGNPMADVVQRQADQAQARLYRQQDRSEDMGFRQRQEGRQQVEMERRDAERRQDREDALRREAAARLPQGWRLGANGQAEQIPGLPPPAAAQRNVQTAQTDQGLFVVNPDGTLGTRLGGLPSAARSAEPRPLPESTRTKLGAAGEAAQSMRSLGDSFQDAYGGFMSGKVGDATNLIARNTPGESPRADWWAQYQERTNITRNQLFGSALTSTEKAEFDKANINPGMSPAAIRLNLQRQAAATQRALHKLGSSMMTDGYRPESIGAAAGFPPEFFAGSLPEFAPTPERGSGAPSPRSVTAGSGDRVRPAETVVPSPFAAGPGDATRPAPAGAADQVRPATAARPLPTTSNGYPDTEKMGDGEQFALPDGSVLRWNKSRRTFTQE